VPGLRSPTREGSDVGSLTVPGPAGPLAFSRDLSPAEWRVLRRGVKRAAIAANLARAVTGDAAPGRVTGGRWPTA
jgi:hypothetical protein